MRRLRLELRRQRPRGLCPLTQQRSGFPPEKRALRGPCLELQGLVPACRADFQAFQCFWKQILRKRTGGSRAAGGPLELGPAQRPSPSAGNTDLQIFRGIRATIQSNSNVSPRDPSAPLGPFFSDSTRAFALFGCRCSWSTALQVLFDLNKSFLLSKVRNRPRFAEVCDVSALALGRCFPSQHKIGLIL